MKVDVPFDLAEVMASEEEEGEKMRTYYQSMKPFDKKEKQNRFDRTANANNIAAAPAATGNSNAVAAVDVAAASIDAVAIAIPKPKPKPRSHPTFPLLDVPFDLGAAPR